MFFLFLRFLIKRPKNFWNIPCLETRLECKKNIPLRTKSHSIKYLTFQTQIYVKCTHALVIMFAIYLNPGAARSWTLSRTRYSSTWNPRNRYLHCTFSTRFMRTYRYLYTLQLKQITVSTLYTVHSKLHTVVLIKASGGVCMEHQILSSHPPVF